MSVLALPPAWRFLVHNKTGVTFAFSTQTDNEVGSARFKKYNFDSSNLADWDASATVQSAATDLADGAIEALAATTGETKTGLAGVFEAKTDNASAAGDLVLLIEWSQDGGTTWPSGKADFDPDAEARQVGVINFNGAEDKSVNIAV